MKKLLLLLMTALGTLVINAQPPAGNANPGEWYGKQISASNAVDIKDIAANLETKTSFETKVRAKVVDVCAKMGCWLKLAINDSTTAFVKMKDYGFFLPEAIKGKTIILDGQAAMKTTSVSELRHYAEDSKKSKEQVMAITRPENELSFIADGILVVEE